LWVCQRYDLEEGQEPHDYNLSKSEAQFRYRLQANKLDQHLASFYWESVWLEGARSHLLDAMQTKSHLQSNDIKRQIVVLASDFDAKAKVSPQEFLPICVLPGLIDETVPLDAQYGTLRSRQRKRVAWSLKERIVDFPGRVLFILGASKDSDLDKINEVLEDAPLFDLKVVVVWPPENSSSPPSPDNLAIQSHIFRGTGQDLFEALKTVGAPSSHQLPRWAIRIRSRQTIETIEFSVSDIDRITKRFILLTEQNLMTPSKFKQQDLFDFLDGHPTHWAGFGVGLPVERSYRTENDQSLHTEVLEVLKNLLLSTDNLLTQVLKLPCEGGSGATTLLRHTAFQAAKAGYPTLVLHHEQINLDVEELAAFLTTLSETSLANGINQMPPTLLIFDIEHVGIAQIRQLSQLLAAQGRKVLILQAVPLDRTLAKPSSNRKRFYFPPLKAELQPGEVQRCFKIFNELVRRWKLPLEVPTIQQWQAYEQANRLKSPGNNESSDRSLFWVALRYFLKESADFMTTERIQDALGQWIEKRTVTITDPLMQEFVKYIAALSSLRIITPLFTALRPVTGGHFSSQLVEILKQLSDLIEWGNYSEELEDQVVRFYHPAIAEEYLHRLGAYNIHSYIQILEPLLKNLSPGSSGDVWIAEALSAIIMPRFKERKQSDWEWLSSSVFDKLPPSLCESSKTLLHHWARCLYLSASSTTYDETSPLLSKEERHTRFEMSVQKLRKAIELPRRSGRDENPSHLYNTLGTAWARYADYLHELGKSQDEARAWDKACEAFEQSLSLLNANVEALLAFSRRLLSHTNSRANDLAQYLQINEVTQALSLLDAAEEIMQHLETPEASWDDNLHQLKSEALDKLNTEYGKEYIQELKSNNPDIGYYCEARLMLKDAASPSNIEQTLKLFESAEQQAIKPGLYSLSFWIYLLNQHQEKRYDFNRLYELYRRLETEPRYIPRVLDTFRQAVLCYQLGEYNEGAKKFQLLRDRSRRHNVIPFRIRDIWRDSHDHRHSRQTQMRVTRKITEWRAEGYVSEMQQKVQFRPRHFSPPPLDQ
jgi:tetratricopeptide (TPR) repeat protein